jgi:hypothetical protein
MRCAHRQIWLEAARRCSIRSGRDADGKRRSGYHIRAQIAIQAYRGGLGQCEQRNTTGGHRTSAYLIDDRPPLPAALARRRAPRILLGSGRQRADRGVILFPPQRRDRPPGEGAHARRGPAHGGELQPAARLAWEAQVRMSACLFSIKDRNAPACGRRICVFFNRLRRASEDSDPFANRATHRNRYPVPD